jgi:type IV pilus assembly protein PilX
MLTKRYNRIAQRASQKGVILVIALIVLVAMTLAAIALIRSVDTSNIVAGNLAFQQSASHSGDAAIEAAVSWLESCNNGGGTQLIGDDGTNGYSADGTSVTHPHNPTAGQTWDDFWRATLSSRSKLLNADADSAGNKSFYVIDRLCANPGSPTDPGVSCSASTLTSSAKGNAEEGGEIPLNSSALVFYRITVRTTGPRNTLSYIQVMVAL